MKHLRLALLLFLTCMAGTRCDDDGGHDDSIAGGETTVWRWNADRAAESEEEDYFWQTTLREAWVKYRVSDYDGGTFRLRIYDDDGFNIFDKEYHHGDNRTTPTFLGRPGVWHIRGKFSSFTGRLHLTIDAAPPSFFNAGSPFAPEDLGSSLQED